MESSALPVLNLIVNVLLALVGFFGGLVLKNLADSIKELRAEDKALRDKMDGFVKVDVLEIWRKEQREDTKLLFSKLEEIRDGMRTKISRDECGTCSMNGGK